MDTPFGLCSIRSVRTGTIALGTRLPSRLSFQYNSLLAFRGLGFVFRVLCSVFRVLCFMFRVPSFLFRISGFGFRVPGYTCFVFGISGFGFGDELCNGTPHPVT